MGHLDQLILDMGSLCRARHIARQRGCADQHVAYADLAAAVALAMVAREALDDHAGKLDLAIEEDAVVRDEYAVENDQHLVPAVNLVANVDVIVLLKLAGIAALAAVDQGDAVRVGRDRKGDGIVLVALAHGDGRHDQHLVGVDEAGLVCLRAGDVNAVGGALHDMQEQVGVGLLGGGLGTVALDVGHRAVDRKVLFLHAGEELDEILMVLGAAGFVSLICSREHRVHRVHAHAALEACGGLLAEQALHLDLLDQVVGGLVHMGEAVDLLAGDVGSRSHKVFVLRVLRELIGCGKGIERGTDYRVVDRVFDLLAEHPQVEVQLAQALNILGFGHHSDRFPFFVYIFRWSARAPKGHGPRAQRWGPPQRCPQDEPVTPAPQRASKTPPAAAEKTCGTHVGFFPSHPASAPLKEGARSPGANRRASPQGGRTGGFIFPYSPIP